MRRAPSKPQKKLNALELGCCLLGLEMMRRLQLPCPSDMDVLRAYGAQVDVSDARTVAGLVQDLKAAARTFVVDTMEPRAGAGPVTPDV